MARRNDAFDPAGMLLASLAACILKSADRVVPMLAFDLRGIGVALHGVRQDGPSKMIGITYQFTVDTDETNARIVARIGLNRCKVVPASRQAAGEYTVSAAIILSHQLTTLITSVGKG